ncbi:MAG TPA: hypothetical protein VGL32_02840, partial [Acidimicrobiales bacterium]
MSDLLLGGQPARLRPYCPLLSEDLLSYQPTNLPDAAFGKSKSLVVLYALDGKAGIAECRDDQPL